MSNETNCHFNHDDDYNKPRKYLCEAIKQHIPDLDLQSRRELANFLVAPIRFTEPHLLDAKWAQEEIMPIAEMCRQKRQNSEIPELTYNYHPEPCPAVKMTVKLMTQEERVQDKIDAEKKLQEYLVRLEKDNAEVYASMTPEERASYENFNIPRAIPECSDEEYFRQELLDYVENIKVQLKNLENLINDFL